MIYSFAGDRRKRTSEEEDEKRRSRTRKGRKSNRRGRRRMRSKGTHQKKIPHTGDIESLDRCGS